MRKSETVFYFILVAIIALNIYSAIQQVKLDKQLRKAELINEYRDSIWYAHHEIREQIQERLTGNPDSSYILRQIVAESGNFDSPQFRRNRNLFGFHNGKDYLKFNHWQESYDYFMTRFYCDKRYGESYCDFIRRRKFGHNGVVDYCMEK